MEYDARRSEPAKPATTLRIIFKIVALLLFGILNMHKSDIIIYFSMYVRMYDHQTSVGVIEDEGIL